MQISHFSAIDSSFGKILIPGYLSWIRQSITPFPCPMFFPSFLRF